MRTLVFSTFTAALALNGCAGQTAVVDPGHLGIVFDPMHGVRHDAVGPGFYRLSSWCRAMKCPRIDDFDITFSTKKEDVATTSQEGLGLELHLAISPVLLGQGEALFAGLDLPALGYTCTEVVPGERATHVLLGRRP